MNLFIEYLIIEAAVLFIAGLFLIYKDHKKRGLNNEQE